VGEHTPLRREKMYIEHFLDKQVSCAMILQGSKVDVLHALCIL